MNVIHGKYYPHIDGIRAIAVISVVVYHLFSTLCPGGFAGVDLFFVISGYLITGGILSSLEKGSFSIRDFYTRRIRRIIPAYLVLVAFVLVAGILVFPPLLMGRTFSTATASAVFATNIFLYFKTGYFEMGAETNPLLHLWSLGIEEQFYLFIPVFLFLVYRICKKGIFPFLILCSLVSLGISLFCTAGGYDNFNFYMLPARAWELLAGSLLAYMNRRPFSARSLPLIVKNSLGLLGMIVFLGFLFLYTTEIPFPGAGAVPPVAAACLMIRWGNLGAAKRLLESRPFVGVGKISYSLYLWHWPLIVLWNYFSDHSGNPWGRLSVLGLSFLMGWLSWRFVELPVRLSKVWNFRRAMLWGAGGCCLLAASGAGLLMADFSRKWTKEFFDAAGECREYFSDHASSLSTSRDLGSFDECGNVLPDQIISLGENKSPSYALWGDSHAASLAAGFDQVSRRTGINGIFINRRHYFAYKMQLALEFGVSSVRYPHNAESIDNALIFLSEHPEIGTVFVLNRWPLLVEGISNENSGRGTDYRVDYFARNGTLAEGSSCLRMKECLEAFCRDLKKINKRVVFISPIPEQEMDVPSVCYKNSLIKWPPPSGVGYEKFVRRSRRSKNIIEELEAKGLAEILWVDGFFFPDKTKCVISNEEGRPLYFDSNHLNIAGSCALMKYLEDSFRDKMKD